MGRHRSGCNRVLPQLFQMVRYRYPPPAGRCGRVLQHHAERVGPDRTAAGGSRQPVSESDQIWRHPVAHQLCLILGQKDRGDLAPGRCRRQMLRRRPRGSGRREEQGRTHQGGDSAKAADRSPAGSPGNRIGPVIQLRLPANSWIRGPAPGPGSNHRQPVLRRLAAHG